MPLRDYECEDCAWRFEFLQKKKEKPRECPACGHKNPKQLVSGFAMAVRHNTTASKFRDEMKKGEEIKQELKEDHGIEGISPMGGNTLQDVHDDVKAQGSFVKDKMQETQEKNEKKRREKRREWMKKALKRSPERRITGNEKRAEEAAKKRKITVSR